MNAAHLYAQLEADFIKSDIAEDCFEEFGVVFGVKLCYITISERG